jgi:hypothetical protein
MAAPPNEGALAVLSVMLAYHKCDLNRSTQHSILLIKEEDVVDEIPNEDLLHRRAKGADGGRWQRGDLVGGNSSSFCQGAFPATLGVLSDFIATTVCTWPPAGCGLPVDSQRKGVYSSYTFVRLRVSTPSATTLIESAAASSMDALRRTVASLATGSRP